MDKKLLHLLGIGQILFLAMVILNGCGGSSSSSSGSSGTSTPTSSVGGTVSGLLGTGLVLQNNGGDNLAIAADQKTFKFPTRVKEGSRANITILTQPTSPAQKCTVLNGSRIVGVDNIYDVEVKCVTTFLETFDNNELNQIYWHSNGEFDRQIVDSHLQFNLTSNGEFASDYLPFIDSGCGKISADVTIANTAFTGPNDKDFRALVQNCSYHSATVGEEPGSRIGDVNAQIISRGDQVSYRIFRCLSNDCIADSIEYLNPGGNGGDLLGTVPPASTATLMIDWNTMTPGQFTFQLNNNNAVTFNPVMSGWPIAAAVPNKPEKYLGVSIAALSDPNDSAEMTATFDNVIADGVLYDNFDNGIYLDGSLWQKTNGKMQIGNGKLFLENGQEFVDDADADNRFNSTFLKSNNNIILNADIVEADITLDPATFVIDSGGNPAEVSAQLQMEFQPPGSDQNDYTNSFVILGELIESPLGISAAIVAQGCANYSCSTKYNIAGDNQTFTTPIDEGQPYHLKIEHIGGGVFDITLNNHETLSVDLSSIPAFATTEFSAMRIKTTSRRTDISGEEAFIRASFDNIRAGKP